MLAHFAPMSLGWRNKLVVRLVSFKSMMKFFRASLSSFVCGSCTKQWCGRCRHQSLEGLSPTQE
jgi:hypothetical protein